MFYRNHCCSTDSSLNTLATIISPQKNLFVVNSADVMNITFGSVGSGFLIDRFTSAGVQACLDNTTKNEIKLRSL